MCRKVKLLIQDWISLAFEQCDEGKLTISACQKRSLNSPNLSDLLQLSFKYQLLPREMILNQHRNSPSLKVISKDT